MATIARNFYTLVNKKPMVCITDFPETSKWKIGQVFFSDSVSFFQASMSYPTLILVSTPGSSAVGLTASINKDPVTKDNFALKILKKKHIFIIFIFLEDILKFDSDGFSFLGVCA